MKGSGAGGFLSHGHLAEVQGRGGYNQLTCSDIQTRVVPPSAADRDHGHEDYQCQDYQNQEVSSPHALTAPSNIEIDRE
jgi:hypothetical protein